MRYAVNSTKSILAKSKSSKGVSALLFAGHQVPRQFIMCLLSKCRIICMNAAILYPWIAELLNHEGARNCRSAGGCFARTSSDLSGLTNFCLQLPWHQDLCSPLLGYSFVSISLPPVLPRSLFTENITIFLNST